MKKVVSIFGMLFILATICTVALADPVPGALLYLDARDNPAHDKAWTNLGTVGGELSGAGKPPVLEEGTIAIPALGIDTISKFYTHEKSGQCWGDQGDNLKLFLEYWTIEFLFKINGDSHKNSPRNQFVGFQPKKLRGENAIRLTFQSDIGELWGQFNNVQAALRPNKGLEEGVWTWMTLLSGDTIKILHEGKIKNLLPGARKFNKETPIEVVIIGANSYGERDQTFNGSVALVRIYDRVLSKDEINQNITAWTEWRSVDPSLKLSTTWGSIKGE
jgi:hypothetical protein